MCDFVLGPKNKEEIAKKIVNLLAAHGVTVGDVPHILSCVRNITDMKIETFIKAEQEKPVRFCEGLDSVTEFICKAIEDGIARNTNGIRDVLIEAMK